MTNALSTLRNTTYTGITMPATLQSTLFTKSGGYTTKSFSPTPIKVENLTHQPIYNYSRCWWNSMLNKDNYYALNGKRLRLRFGAMFVDGFSLFGERDWKNDDWFKAIITDKSGGTNAHCWLEDEQGNIYDKFFPEYEACYWGQTGKRTRKAKMDEVYEGISPRQLLLTRGVSYKTMPDKCAEFLLEELLVGETARVMGQKWMWENIKMVDDEVKRCLSYDD